MHEIRLKGNFIGGIINYSWSLQPTYIDQNDKQVLQFIKIILNEEEAPIVKHIFTAYVAGKKATTIAHKLNRHSVRNRIKLFQNTTIYSILQQEKYTSIYKVNNITYNQIYPQIVPLDIYEIVH